MIPIIERLWLGNRESARDLGRLKALGITHVVNCADELPDYHPNDLRYLSLKLTDPDPLFHRHLERIGPFIDEGRKAGGVLVHCFAGVSRSPSVLLFYLCHLGEPLPAAADKLAKAVWTNPDLLFLKQIAEHLEHPCDAAALDRLSRVLCGRPLED
ncbi:MAG: dual specificity protein phosphatase family protein [Gemmataceae bacterium]|nr:dual specificity protein phosphatase family protein [Gemmataceae bacterium]